MRGDAAAVTAALAEIRDSLGVDGYLLDVTSATTTDLRVRISATEGACEDCLVPPEVLKMIISGGVDGTYVPDEIDVTMPAH